MNSITDRYLELCRKNEAFFKQVEDYLFREDEPRESDVIFLPGNRYPQMAEKSAALYRDGYAPFILPSGKYAVSQNGFAGPIAKREIYQGDYATEWEFLSDVLRHEGVPSEAILREDQAGYTWQNALFSRRVLDAENIRVRQAIICCKTTHARRCLLYYQCAFPEAELFVCPVDADGISRRTWRETPEGIETVMGEAERLVLQFSLLMPGRQQELLSFYEDSGIQI